MTQNDLFDSEASLREARSRMPFEVVMEQFGHGSKGGRWRSFTCPHCHKKSKAGLFNSNTGARLFKCQSTSCPTGARAMDEVGYIAFVNGASRADAFVAYLKMAGVWRERHLYRSSPGSDGQQPPTAQPAPTPEATSGQQAPAMSGSSTPAPLARAPIQAFDYSHSAQAGPTGASSFPSPETNGPEPELGTPTALFSHEPTYATDEPSLTHPASPEGNAPPAPESPPATEASSLFNDGPPLEDLDEESEASIAEPATEESQPAVGQVTALQSLRWFYERLTLSPEDERILFERRGIATSAAAALGFKSNTRANLALLEAAAQQFPEAVLLQAGLWSAREKAPPAPNKQFHGYGHIGKKKVDGKEVDEWGWTQPILIPYFDADGELIHLQPHKGGAKGVRRQLYIPRRAGVKATEEFSTVLLTEGEFKAASLWQVAGGRIGIGALPGIQMANNYAVNEELEDWLRAVKARRVVIVYDNEEKSDPNKPGYKSDPKKRHDASIWERILASKLEQRLRIKALVWKLPNDWRDEKGKADWDGFIAAFVKQRQAAA